MATIGALGDVIFSVSPNLVRTFNGFKRSASPKYASHNRHLKDTLLEFVGNDPDKISFSVTLSAYLGVDPQREESKLWAAQKQGKIMRLVLGKENFGNWVISSLSSSYNYIDNKGNVFEIKVDLSLTAYAGR